eukprot:SAG11_NODE_1363_length_5110_cov_7.005588_5_plen_48_part_00
MIYFKNNLVGKLGSISDFIWHMDISVGTNIDLVLTASITERQRTTVL